MKYEAIIFDLGGVIINLDYQRTTKAFEELGMTNFQEVYSQVAQTDLFNQFETGMISSQHFINKLLPYLPTGASANRVVNAWNAMILDVPKEKTRLLSFLKNTTRTFLLSNTNDIHMQKVRREWSKVSEFPMENYFEKIYLSHELKMRKPNSDIFLHVCNENTLDPSKTLFIDDTLQHIEGAQKIGLQTIHLTDPNALYALFS